MIPKVTMRTNATAAFAFAGLILVLSADRCTSLSVNPPPAVTSVRKAAPAAYAGCHNLPPKNAPGVCHAVVSSPEHPSSRLLLAAASSAAGDADSVASSSSDGGLRFRTTFHDLSRASLVGVATGMSVAIFKVAIETISSLSRRTAALAAEAAAASPVGTARHLLLTRGVTLLIPALGGILVGILSSRHLFGSTHALPPGLRDQVRGADVDTASPPRGALAKFKGQLGSVRKTVAAAITLGTGNSLGPEGPSVEVGVSLARAWSESAWAGPSCGSRTVAEWNRLLLACGAAAGVAAGFDAPFAGVFFALEVMKGVFGDVDSEAAESGADGGSTGREGVLTITADMYPVILSSALAALVARTIVEPHLFLRPVTYSLGAPLREMPLYILLGAMSGFVAFAFSFAAKKSQSFFAGELGGKRVRRAMSAVPPNARPALGGLVCGTIGLLFPQVLFSGHGTLGSLVGNGGAPPATKSLLALLAAKIVATAAAAGSGLVGGTFAPSLFLGGVAGGIFHNVVSGALGAVGVTSAFAIADLPAHAMVGAASVLAGLFRAPLTASLLLFELTRDYAVLLPFMASGVVASVVGDVLDDKVERSKERRRDRDAVSWGDQ